MCITIYKVNSINTFFAIRMFYKEYKINKKNILKKSTKVGTQKRAPKQGQKGKEILNKSPKQGAKN